jgi:hypothetical protein
MPLIAIDEEEKTKLDKLAVKLAEKQGVKSVSYAAVMAEVFKQLEAE